MSDAPPMKTCDYCPTTGRMPTFMNGETICTKCLHSLPETTRELHAEIFKLRKQVEELNAPEIDCVMCPQCVRPYAPDRAVCPYCD